jgi:hypothetical protein
MFHKWNEKNHAYKSDTMDENDDRAVLLMNHSIRVNNETIIDRTEFINVDQ